MAYKRECMDCIHYGECWCEKYEIEIIVGRVDVADGCPGYAPKERRIMNVDLNQLDAAKHGDFIVALARHYLTHEDIIECNDNSMSYYAYIRRLLRKLKEMEGRG